MIKNYYKILKQSDYTEEEIEDIFFKRKKLEVLIRITMNC